WWRWHPQRWRASPRPRRRRGTPVGAVITTALTTMIGHTTTTGPTTTAIAATRSNRIAILTTIPKAATTATDPKTTVAGAIGAAMAMIATTIRTSSPNGRSSRVAATA